MIFLWVLGLSIAVCLGQDLINPKGADFCDRGTPSCSDYTTLRWRLADIENFVRLHESQIKDRLTQTGNQDDVYRQLQELKSNVEKVEATNQLLTSQVANLSLANLKLEDEIRRNKVADQQLADQHTTDVETLSRNIQRMTDRVTVGFSARADRTSGYSNITSFYSITKVGGGYSNTGVFTCRVAGYYVFNMQLTGDNTNRVYGILKKNGDEVVAVAYSVHDNTNTNIYPSASELAITHLVPGDTVHVYSNAALDGYSSFTGFLLYPDVDPL